MKAYVVMRFDPMQCGACGNGNLDKIFTSRQEAEAYIRDEGPRRGVSWEIKEQPVETYARDTCVPA